MTQPKKKIYPIRAETMQVWEERLERFANSDLSVGEFCVDEGISRHTFLMWRSRLLAGFQTHVDKFWARKHEAFEKSEQSLADFCRQNGLCQSVFSQKRMKKNRRGTSKTKRKKSSDRPLERPPRVSDQTIEKLVIKSLPSAMPKKETIELWYDRLTRFFASGLSIEEFSQQEGVASAYVSQWGPRNGDGSN